ncbi:hypothetical protein BDN67DRAFT_425591 [Paxillus ammoniavirescens]|nr:hypothetical protein BDN67DRAFT_425591 [Paxillus ammoniavirescens]
MPPPLSILKLRRTSGFPSFYLADARPAGEFYFPPGGGTYHRHIIPPDQLRISFSDPVLVAAEEKLREITRLKEQIPGNESVTDPTQGSLETPGDSCSKFETSSRAVPSIFHIESGSISRASTDHPEGLTAIKYPVKRSPTTRTRRTIEGLKQCWRTTVRTCPRSPKILVTRSLILSAPNSSYEGPGTTAASMNANLLSTSERSSSEHIKCTPNLAPLASETFKEELYIRGYLRRPSNAISHDSDANPMFPNGGVSPRVLGRRRGQIIAEQLRVLQNPTMSPRLHSSVAEIDFSTYFSCVSLPTPSSAGMESPGMQTVTSASSATFDLNEFSYITAFTTPPSSPSMDLRSKKFERTDPF